MIIKGIALRGPLTYGASTAMQYINILALQPSWLGPDGPTVHPFLYHAHLALSIIVGSVRMAGCSSATHMDRLAGGQTIQTRAGGMRTAKHGWMPSSGLVESAEMHMFMCGLCNST